jgi:hypothetical protein
LNEYNGWSGSQRMASFRLLQKAMADGSFTYDPRCDMCSLAEGTIQLHNEDYSIPTSAVPICVECHMLLHTRFTHPNRWLRHCLMVARGGRSKPWRSVGHYFKAHPWRNDERELDPMFEWPELAALTPTWWLALKLYKINLKEAS